MKKYIYWQFVLVLSLINTPVFCQLTPESISQFIQPASRRTDIISFYEKMNYKKVWVDDENKINRTSLITMLEQAADKGLDPKKYELSYLRAFNTNKIKLLSSGDSLEADLRITCTAIAFLRDITFGNTIPPLGHAGLKYTPSCKNIPFSLANAIVSKSLGKLLSEIPPLLPEIPVLEEKIKWLNSVMTDSSFKEVIISSNKVTTANKPLMIKLNQLGILNTRINITDSALKQKLKEAQQSFELLDDGILRSTILKELNIPLQNRLEQLRVAINYYRWLSCLVQSASTIVVNIPAAAMKVYRGGTSVLEMRMIVGKPSTPTPTLSSTADQIILYPYWHVPYSIATKELLPLIKRNPGFIDAGNYQVLNSAGKIVNPYAVNWKALSRNYFPYLIRQSTGCDNALGLLKLNFYNPFGVYLHDTPNKSLFMMNKRYFSHGCMRMEKPMELGHLLLKNNAIAIDTLEQKGCLSNQAPVIVPAEETMAVIVWYNPAGIDAAGKVVFYEDVYDKFHWIK